MSKSAGLVINAGHMRNSFIMTLILGVVMSISSVALAGSNPDIDVEFDAVEVYSKRGDAVLDYTIDSRSWRQLRKASIEPRLNIYTPGRRGRYVYRYSVPLKDRKGRILYNKRDVDIDGIKSVRIEVVGYSGAFRVDEISYKSKESKLLTINVSRARRTHDDRHDDRRRDRHDDRRGDRHDDRRGDRHDDGRRASASKADLIKACDRQTSYDSELNKCVELALELPFPRVADKVVDACGVATSYSSGLNSCLKESAKLQGRPVEAVSACGKATSYDSEVKSCLQKAADFNHRNAGEVIAACDAHTSYSSDLNSCISAAKKLDRDHAAVVNACGGATRYASELRRCIEKSAR